MKSSELTSNLAEALANAQAEYPAIGKAHTANAGSYKYTYADLADTVEGAKQINAHFGLAVSQIPEWMNGADVLTTRLMHSSGEWLEGTSRLFLSAENPQSHGSAITYQRRYSYCAILGIVADEDDDGAAGTTHGPLGGQPLPKGASYSALKVPSPDKMPRKNSERVVEAQTTAVNLQPNARFPDARKPSGKQLNFLNGLMAETGVDLIDLVNAGILPGDITNPTDLTGQECSTAIESLIGVRDGSIPFPTPEIRQGTAEPTAPSEDEAARSAALQFDAEYEEDQRPF